MDKEAKFLKTMQNCFQQVLLYERPSLQKKARDIIPIQALYKKADAKYKKICQRLSQGKELMDLEECLLLSLLDWFKNDFFTWKDNSSCTVCNGETTFVGNSHCLPEEMVWDAGNVECYVCHNCNAVTRFPRYNNPEKLLETKTGRCGEWANCFTLCCRVLGFEARFVHGWFDHVWTEVYLKTQQQWIHCDPCENICDKPLLYEVGWGKKINYILAFSRDEIQDVTWRYSSKHVQTLENRTECRENWLISAIMLLRRKRQARLSETRKGILTKRLVLELVEFMTPKSASSHELGGRTSGSLAWRLARNEIGHEEKNYLPYIFTPSEEEKQKHVMCVKYNCAKDIYLRPFSKTPDTCGWDQCIYYTNNIFRKEEADWKMVYLARKEGTRTAKVSWKFDFSDTGLKVKMMKVFVSDAVFESGCVHWELYWDLSHQTLKDNHLSAALKWNPVPLMQAICRCNQKHYYLNTKKPTV